MNTRGGVELYVYYRVAMRDWPRALDAVRGFQQRLQREHPGLSARVLRRPGDSGGHVTLMETYAFDDGQQHGLDEAVSARIRAAAEALTPLLTSPRQAEAFEPLD